jgi:hypothetical protein
MLPTLSVLGLSADEVTIMLGVVLNERYGF